MLAGIVLVGPHAADARSLCIANGANPSIVVLTSPKMRKGRTYSVSGYRYNSVSGSAAPVTGASIVNDAGTRTGLALQVWGGVSVTQFGAFTGPGVSVVNVAFADSSLEPGDSGSGYFGGSPTSFTVVDCAGVEPIP
jgi:hypothetical protein